MSRSPVAGERAVGTRTAPARSLPPHLQALYDRVCAGIDWGRIGPWPPDAVSALDELVGLVADASDTPFTEPEIEDVGRGFDSLAGRP